MERTKGVWAGYIISGLAILFFLMDAAGKFAKPDVVVSTTVGLGYLESQIITIGVIWAFLARRTHPRTFTF